MSMRSMRVKLLVAGAALIAPMIAAQAADPDSSKAIVSLYHAAPGKQLELLKWFAVREAVDKEAGVPVQQFYVHTDGDSWDFMSIGPQLTDAESTKVDELAKKKGLKTGFAAALEFRQMISSHTDTYVRGPSTASELVKAAGGK